MSSATKVTNTVLARSRLHPVFVSSHGFNALFVCENARGFKVLITGTLRLSL